jgi:serine/threonine protein kinase
MNQNLCCLAIHDTSTDLIRLAYILACVADAARLVRQVASALAFLHDLGLVHSDLKRKHCFVLYRVQVLHFEPPFSQRHCDLSSIYTSGEFDVDE